MAACFIFTSSQPTLLTHLTLGPTRRQVLCSAASLLGNLGSKGADSQPQPPASSTAAASAKTLLGKFRQTKPGSRPATAPRSASGPRKDCLMSELHATYLAVCTRVQVSRGRPSSHLLVDYICTEKKHLDRTPSTSNPAQYPAQFRAEAGIC